MGALDNQAGTPPHEPTLGPLRRMPSTRRTPGWPPVPPAGSVARHGEDAAAALGWSSATRAAGPHTAVDSAIRLRALLADDGAPGTIVARADVALILLGNGMQVWCYPGSYSWWTGRFDDARRHRNSYAYVPSSDPDTAVLRLREWRRQLSARWAR